MSFKRDKKEEEDGITYLNVSQFVFCAQHFPFFWFISTNSSFKQLKNWQIRCFQLRRQK